MIWNCEMVREELFNENVEPLGPHFQSKVIPNLKAFDESEEFDTSMDTLKKRLLNVDERGSNWRFQRVISLDILNTKNANNQRLKWCITRAFNMVQKDPQRITKLLGAQFEKVDWSGINFPMKLTDMSKFEKQNENNVVNV